MPRKTGRSPGPDGITCYHPENAILRLPKSKHSQTQVFGMLREGESGGDLWNRLPLVDFDITEDRVYSWTKLTAGNMAAALVVVMEPEGPHVYRAGFQRWEGGREDRGGNRVAGKVGLVEVFRRDNWGGVPA